MQRSQGANLPDEASSISFRAVLRQAVLTCLGRGIRCPYLEEERAGSELRVNPGTAAPPVNAVKYHWTYDPITAVAVLEPTKTVLLVKGRLVCGTGLPGKRIEFSIQ